MSEPAPHDRPFPPGAFEPYVPAVIPPDPARDARVAARRAYDARRAGAALEALIGATPGTVAAYGDGWRDGYAACELHHNRHYDASDQGDAWADAWPDGAV